MDDGAPTPTLNDTGPQINLLPQFAESGSLPAIDFNVVVPVVFTIMFIVWAIYTLVVTYHWFRYHHRSWFAVPAIVLHVTVSSFIILYMVSGLIL